VLYIDTSVLLVYTLTQALEPARYTSTRKLVAKIATGKLDAADVRPGSVRSLRKFFLAPSAAVAAPARQTCA
jgi:hypothetical protein